MGDVTARFLAVPGHPHRHDVLIAVVGLAGGLILWALGLDAQGSAAVGARWAALIPLTVMAAMELLRRTRPQTALVVATLALVADQVTVGNLGTILMFTDVIYAAVVYGTPAAARRIPVTSGLITVAVAIGFLAWFQKPEALLIGVVTGLVSFAPATTGAMIRNHREAAEAARLRAEQTALLAEIDRTQAVTAERARMARELHDVVANHLSAIAIHATAAQSIGDPEATGEALAVIRENSVQGLAEMRRLIGLLRDAGAADEPSAAPRLDGLEALLTQVRRAGAAARGASAPVPPDGSAPDSSSPDSTAPGGLRFVLRDERPADAPAPPVPVELAAYRIIQEALTNALKHATAGEVLVRLGFDARPPGTAPDARGPLTVQVISPYGDASGPRAPGSGAGLIGMRERVALLGGEFDAGPVAAPAHGQAGVTARAQVWQVRAVLPVGEERTR
ncbi:sensor histidine kinase [Streptomyces sp. NPDC048639]|uniref:sensor histidine kinase n=1 Tax=Streptomyces sp. NPDC048639 TaxID=3365581 RepID=UPI00371C073C